MSAIHLPDIKTFVYTVAKHTERQGYINQMMKELEFSNWEFLFGSEGRQPYWVNIHSDWIQLLATPVPFLLLEDDATITSHYSSDVTYPDDAQMVYLGGTANGELENMQAILDISATTDTPLRASNGPRTWPGHLVYSEREDDYIRVYNMHSTHAILFVDQQTATDFQVSINAYRDRSAVDVVFARGMHKYKTYCRKQPFWYQNDGHHNDPTLRYYP